MMNLMSEQVSDQPLPTQPSDSATQSDDTNGGQVESDAPHVDQSVMSVGRPETTSSSSPLPPTSEVSSLPAPAHHPVSSPLLIVLALSFLIILPIAGLYWYLTGQNVGTSLPFAVSPSPTMVISKSPTATVTPQPTIAIVSELPPLYPGLEWEATESGEFEFTTKEGEKVELVGFQNTVKRTEVGPDDFLGYYTEELEKRNWVQVPASIATGPGGADVEYKNDNKYFIFSIFPIEGNPDKGFTAYQATVTYSATP